MKALLLDRPGPVESLRHGEIPDPNPNMGEILVRCICAGLNPVDYKTAGRGIPGWIYPHVLGLDVAGIVEAVGPHVSGFATGDRVMAHLDLQGQGALAEMVSVPSHVVAKIPEPISFEQAAALPCAGFSAWQAVHHRLHLQPGQTVLVNGGGGGVGGFCVQLARLAKARVFATCSGAKESWVRSLGADAVIDYSSGRVPERIRELTKGRGVEAVLDTVSGESATASLQLLAYSGAIVTFAGRPDLNTVAPFTTAPSVHEVALGAVYKHGSREDQQALASTGAELLDLVLHHGLDPMVSRVVALDEVPAALAELRSRRVRGKIVVRVLP